MTTTLPLDTLIDLAQARTDEATRRLGELQCAHTSATEKLAMLVQYRQDYGRDLQALMYQGIPSAHCRNFQHFISTLDGAIEQQRALAEQADTRLEQGRDDWRHSKRRLSSFDTLASRAHQHEMVAANKREQRDNDERSARQFQMRSAA